jgi:hypothetical protein
LVYSMSNIDVPQTTLSSTAVAPKAIETAPVNRASGAMQIASVLDQLARPLLLGENERATVSSQKSLEIALKDVNSTLATSNTNLSFSVDPSSKRTIIEVKDGETGDIILKLPGDRLKLSWDDAAGYAQELSEVSGLQWRLATLSEVKSIISSTCVGPAVNPNVFPSLKSSSVWTSSESRGNGDAFKCAISTYNGAYSCRRLKK